MQNPQNLFKRGLAEGRHLAGIWHTLGGAVGAELLASAGFDWVLIDTEHAVAEVTDAFGCLQAVAGYPEVSAVVRVSDNDTALIKRHLDQGAQSVMVPNVRSVEEAERAVAAMHYGPRGVRGVAGITRASRFGTVDNYLATASDELCLILQIESRAGLDALEDIAAVDGVDALFIGPADLAANMGHPGNPGAPEVQAAILDAFARLAAIRMPAGILTLDEAFLARCIDAGARVNAVGVDMALLVASLRELRAKY